jgi:hypothetical protein
VVAHYEREHGIFKNGTYFFFLRENNFNES